MTKHHPIERCVICRNMIPLGRISIDPPEFTCSDRCDAKLRLITGLGSTHDLAWPDPKKSTNPSLVLVRSGHNAASGERVFRRVRIVPREIDDEVWDRKEKKPKI